MSKYNKLRRSGAATQTWRVPAIVALALFVAMISAEVMALIAPAG